MSKEKDKYTCLKAGTCCYGHKFSGATGVYCDYLSITGKMRGGMASECTHYKKGKRRKNAPKSVSITPSAWREYELQHEYDGWDL